MFDSFIHSSVDFIFVFFLLLFEGEKERESEVLTSEKQQQQQQQHYQYLATVSIDYCIALGREDLLFNLVFVQFFKFNQIGIFFERLEPFILGDRIQKHSPEVIKLMLNHYATNKYFRRLEQLILHIPISCLDFHQVVTLCRKYYLTSALIHVFIQALNDYITPMDDLIKVLLKFESQRGNLSQEQQTVVKHNPNETRPLQVICILRMIVNFEC